jgi:hypothetical protein
MMMDITAFLTIGLGLAITALLVVSLKYWRLLERLKTPPVLDERTVNRMRMTMDELGVYQDVHLHRNRDGTIAVALGKLPEIWPEDVQLPDAFD